MVEFGKYRHVFTIERRDAGTNAFRQPLDTWSTVATLWGEVKTLAGRELVTAREIRPETSIRIETRAGGLPFTSADRIDFQGRKLQILGAWDPEERGRVLFLDCSEWKGAANGGA